MVYLSCEQFILLLILSFVSIKNYTQCICSVFEAFGKIRSCKLAPDMLRPGKHRQVNPHEMCHNSLYLLTCNFFVKNSEKKCFTSRVRKGDEDPAYAALEV